MLINEKIVKFIKILKNENLINLCEQAGQAIKRGSVNELLVKVENRFSPGSGVDISLFKNKDGYILANEYPNFYLKMSPPSHIQITFWWYKGNQKYITKSLNLKGGSSIYKFDLSTLKGWECQFHTYKWFRNEQINDFGINCIASCNSNIEWVEFSKNELNFTEANAPLIEVLNYPHFVHLEVTRNCNIKCYMCRENRDEEVKQIGIGDLDCQILDKTIPFMQNATHIALYGWGEPLCHPHFDRFIDAISKIKERNRPELLNTVKPFVNFTTNATLITEDLAHRFIKNGVDEIAVSIDSPNEENYNFIRKGANFKKVIANLRMLQELKKQYGVSYPVLSMQFVAMRRNIEELPEMIKFAGDLGIKRILVYYITVVTKGLEHESLYYHQELANRIFDKTEKLGQANGIDLLLPSRFGTKVEPEGDCNDSKEIFYVRAEGTVIPCCVATDCIIGDLNNESPEEIWKGERRKNFLDSFRNGVLEGKCKNCYKFTGNDINLRETHIKV